MSWFLENINGIYVELIGCFIEVFLIVGAINYFKYRKEEKLYSPIRKEKFAYILKRVRETQVDIRNNHNFIIRNTDDDNAKTRIIKILSKLTKEIRTEQYFPYYKNWQKQQITEFMTIMNEQNNLLPQITGPHTMEVNHDIFIENTNKLITIVEKLREKFITFEHA